MSGRTPLGWAITAATIRSGALQQVPDEGPANAEAQHHEAVNAKGIHQTDLVIGEGVLWPVNLERARGPAVVGIARVQGNTAGLPGEFRDGIERRDAGKITNRPVQSAARQA